LTEEEPPQKSLWQIGEGIRTTSLRKHLRTKEALSNSVCRSLATTLVCTWAVPRSYYRCTESLQRSVGGDRYESDSRRTVPNTDLEEFIGAVEERDQSAGEEIYYHTGNATMRVIGNGTDILIEAQQNMIRAG
jgi:hypothetical protein